MAGIRVELELINGEFTTRMLHAGETVQQFNRNLGNVAMGMRVVEEQSQSMLATLRDVSIVLGLAHIAISNIRAVTTGWAADIIKVNAEIEKTTMLLKGMSQASDPTKDAANQVKFLRDFAKQTPFALSAITDTFVKMKATGIDPTKGALKALTDGVAAFGGGEDVLKRATVAMAQMSGKGVIQMEELRQQLGEAIPRAVELMARSMGVTVGELIQKISKGTVEASSALAAFNGELERTFGGAGLALMKTFNGMMSQSTTLFQDLAIQAGEAGFFDIVKKQLSDMNSFLATPAAASFAQAIGSALTTVVSVLRTVVDWIVRMRSELTLAAEVLALAFAGKVAIAGLLGIAGAISTAITAIRALTIAWGAMSTTMRVATINGSIGQISRVTQVATYAGAILPFVGMAMSGVAAVALPLGLAIGALALTFGTFTDKTRDAYESLEKFGASSRKQVAEASGVLKDLQKAYNSAKSELDSYMAKVGEAPESREQQRRLAMMQAEVVKTEDALNKANEVLHKGQIEGGKKDADELIKIRIAELDEQLAAKQRTYDAEFILASKAHQDDLKARQADHKDTAQAAADYMESSRNRQVTYYDGELKLIEDALARSKLLRETGSADELLIADKLEAQLTARQARVLERQEAIKAMPSGVVTLAKPDDYEKLFGKAQAKIDELSASIAGNKATLAGASGEYAKFIYMLEDAAKKKYGPLDNTEIGKSIELMKQLFAENEKLTEAVDGRTKFDRDLERAHQAAQERLFAAQTRGKNDTDKIAIGVQMGLYKGMKPISLMEQSFQQIDTSARQATEGIKTTFSDSILQAAGKLKDAVAGIADSWNGFKQTVENTKPGQGVMTLAGIMRAVNGDQIKGYTPRNKTDARLTIPNLTDKEHATLEDTILTDQSATDLENANKLTDALEALRLGMLKTTEADGGLNKHLAETQRLIAKGTYGPNKDIDSDQYTKLIAAAREWDKVDAQMADQKKLRTKVQSAMQGQAGQDELLQEKEDELQRRLLAEGRFKFSSEYLRAIAKMERDNANARLAQERGIFPKPDVDKFVAANEAAKQRLTNLEVGNTIQTEQEKNRVIERGLMTQDASREAAFQDEVKRLQDLLALSSINSDQRAMLEKVVQDKIRLFRAQTDAMSPLAKMAKEWGDLTQQMGQASVNWMNGFADKLTEMVTKGKTDFKALADSIIADIIRMIIKATIAKTFSPMLGALGLPVGTMHTGGLVGISGGSSRTVSPSTFFGAPRFHSGGFPGMGPGEVPIIAKKGEEVGWPDQLAQKYGGRSNIQHNEFNANLQGSPGTPAQNQDLTDRMMKGFKEMIQATASAEIRQQMRPGGILRRGK